MAEIIEVVTIGTAADNINSIPDDDYMSGHHARVTFYKDPYAIVIEDLGSTNGIWINGVHTRYERALQPGDEIRIGRTVWKIPTLGDVLEEMIRDGA